MIINATVMMIIVAVRCKEMIDRSNELNICHEMIDRSNELNRCYEMINKSNELYKCYDHLIGQMR